jgi:hypothetical protein
MKNCGEREQIRPVHLAPRFLLHHLGVIADEIRQREVVDDEEDCRRNDEAALRL